MMDSTSTTAMPAADLGPLLQWLYGDDEGHFLSAAARDLRINARNLRGMMSGRMAIPETLADVVVCLVVAHARLNGWADRSLAALELSGPTCDRLGKWQYRWTL